MAEDRPVRWQPRGLEWDGETWFDPETLQPVVPPWRKPYHEAAQTVNELRGEGTDHDETTR